MTKYGFTLLNIQNIKTFIRSFWFWSHILCHIQIFTIVICFWRNVRNISSILKDAGWAHFSVLMFINFTLHFRIAKSQQYDSEGLIDIFRQYGDHLYTKGDHNAAIEQYIKTIGKLEPSYVIRKVHFLLSSVWYWRVLCIGPYSSTIYFFHIWEIKPLHLHLYFRRHTFKFECRLNELVKHCI